MTTSTITPEIEAFARGVRDALADLPVEEVDDLTEGLEADLAESLAEDLRRTLPDPTAYADELRAAAGLPVLASVKRRDVLAGLMGAWDETSQDVLAVLNRRPALAATLTDLAGALRAIWWISRAWVAAWFVSYSFDTEIGYGFHGREWILLGVLVILSVQWGRGRWYFRGLRGPMIIGNLLALVYLVPALDAAHNNTTHLSYAAGYDDGLNSSDSDQKDLTGVYLNGKSVTNIFGYDAKGRPLSNVQLFDQDGHPLATSVPGGNGCLDQGCVKLGLWAPSTLSNGATAWNVFPMKMVEAVSEDGQFDDLTAVTGAVPQDRLSPFVRVPAVQLPPAVTDSKH